MTQLHTFISVCMDSAFLLPDMTETFLSRKDRGEWVWRVCIERRISHHVGSVQGGWGGWPTGNGKKQSSSQAQLGQETFLAVA